MPFSTTGFIIFYYTSFLFIYHFILHSTIRTNGRICEIGERCMVMGGKKTAPCGAVLSDIVIQSFRIYPPGIELYYGYDTHLETGG